MLSFDFLGKGLTLISATPFVHDFSRKINSCYILLTDKISLSDCYYFFRYLAMSVLQYPICDLINFEIYVSLLIKPFTYINKNSEQNLRHLQKEKSF